MAIARNFFTGRGTIPMENLNASRECCGIGGGGLFGETTSRNRRHDP